MFAFVNSANPLHQFGQGKGMEEKTKNDRRVIRTKNALREAFIEIVKEKNYENVTVEDITSRANVGRTTFYLHYQDKEDLLLEELEEQLLLVSTEFTQHPLLFWVRERKGTMIKIVLENIKTNSDIYRMMSRDQSNKAYERFKKIIMRITWKMINESPWAQRRIKFMTIPVELLIEFFSGAMWASIVWWARTDFELSVDEMAKSCQKLFYPGLKKALNLKNINDLIEEVGIDS